MDTKEYNILLDEIAELTAEERFHEAADLADRIDWNRERKTSTLVRISDLYRSCLRYEDALYLMVKAYERNPHSRRIVYQLCELYTELGDHANALDFFGIYKKMDPNATEVYILQYGLLELENAGLDEKIALLEELCRKDYTRPEWRYQLAYLYHRIGLATKCVEECDRMITWFSNGPFVIKAMELKMLHARLTPAQQKVYDAREEVSDELDAYESDEYTNERPDPALGEEDFRVKTIDMGKFNTINLQKALAESMREFLQEEEGTVPREQITGEILRPLTEGDFVQTGEMEDGTYEDGRYEDGADADEDAGYADDAYEGGGYEDEGYHEDVAYEGGGYEDAGYREDGAYEGGGYQENGAYEGGGYEDAGYREDGAYEGGGYQEDGAYEDGAYEDGSEDGDYVTGRDEALPADGTYDNEEEPEIEGDTVYLPTQGVTADAAEVESGEVFFEDRTEDIIIDSPPTGTNPDYEPLSQMADVLRREEAARVSSQDMKEVRRARGHREGQDGQEAMREMLHQGDDGQISLAVPEEPPMERQITGQINLDDLMADWEERKRQKAEARKQETAEVIKRNTGPIFAEFEQRQKNSLVEELERERKVYAEKYRADDIKLRTVQEVIDEQEAQADGVYDAPGHAGGSIWDDVQAAQEAEAAAKQAQSEAARRAAAADDAARTAGQGSGGSIWDDVRAAQEAEAAAAAHMAAAANGTAGGVAGSAGPQVVRMATGSLGFTDAAVAEAEELVRVAAQIPAVQEYPDQGEEAASPEGAHPWDEMDDDPTVGGGYDDYADDDAAQAEDAYDAPEDYGEAYDGEDTDAYADTEEASGGVDAYADAEEATGDAGAYTDAEEATDDADAYTDAEEATDDADAYADVEEAADGEEAYADADEADHEERQDTSGMSTAQMDEISGALEADADRIGVEVVEEYNDEYELTGDDRDFSVDEQALFAPFLYSKKLRAQILSAIDQISLAPYVGNVLITGDEGTGVMDLGKAIVKEQQMIDGNFLSSRVAKISGKKMNSRDIPKMIGQLANGALLIEYAADMSQETIETLLKVLEGMQEGILVILMDEKRVMDELLQDFPMIEGYFNARIDITPMNNNALVDYAKKYAYGREYKIDEERGVLALHQRISELQIGEHHVTTREVEDIVEGAIAHATKVRPATFFAVLAGKRYDYEDMIILREKDFM